MNVLVVGGGGREHALAWKCSQSPLVEKVFVAPGNAGTALDDGMQNVQIAVDDTDALVTFAEQNNVELTVIGPEAPLVAGVVDRFVDRGLRCFGPTAKGAKLEGSKAFAKDFLNRHAIPTAAYGVYADLDEALAAIPSYATPLVVKADGLAAGKGVVIADTHEQAGRAAREMLVDGLHANAGHRIVVEEFLRGEEASFICIVDGLTVVPFASSQDHKARDAGDLGPNTGGMGAYSPAPIVDEKVYQRIMSEVIEPTVQGLKADNIAYTGFLYAGLMIDDQGQPHVLEFNCRFGDPETQPIMMRLRGDIVEALIAACDHQLPGVELEWDDRASVAVIMASGGYPEGYDTGHEIIGLDGYSEPDVNKVGDLHLKVFHCGTKLDSEQDSPRVVTSGGRVLCVTALADSVTQAQAQAYAAVDKIKWTDSFHRRDIGYRAVEREKHSVKT